MLTDRAKHAKAIWKVLKRCKWLTAMEIVIRANRELPPQTPLLTTATATARVRDFRKPQNGGHTIRCEHRAGLRAPAYLLVK